MVGVVIQDLILAVRFNHAIDEFLSVNVLKRFSSNAKLEEKAGFLMFRIL